MPRSWSPIAPTPRAPSSSTSSATCSSRPSGSPSPTPASSRCAAAGERAEAEQIGGEIARLLDSGTDPDEIAVVIRSPERHGPLLDEVLGGLGIPVAVDASVPLRLDRHRPLAARAPARRRGRAELADDVLAFLRGAGRARAPGDVDWLEQRVRRRSIGRAAETLERWAELNWAAPRGRAASRRARGRARGQRRNDRPRARRAPAAPQRAARRPSDDARAARRRSGRRGAARGRRAAGAAPRPRGFDRAARGARRAALAWPSRRTGCGS